MLYTCWVSLLKCYILKGIHRWIYAQCWVLGYFKSNFQNNDLAFICVHIRKKNPQTWSDSKIYFTYPKFFVNEVEFLSIWINSKGKALYIFFLIFLFLSTCFLPLQLNRTIFSSAIFSKWTWKLKNYMDLQLSLYLQAYKPQKRDIHSYYTGHRNF